MNPYIAFKFLFKTIPNKRSSLSRPTELGQCPSSMVYCFIQTHIVVNNFMFPARLLCFEFMPFCKMNLIKIMTHLNSSLVVKSQVLFFYIHSCITWSSHRLYQAILSFSLPGHLWEFWFGEIRKCTQCTSASKWQSWDLAYSFYFYHGSLAQENMSLSMCNPLILIKLMSHNQCMSEQMNIKKKYSKFNYVFINYTVSQGTPESNVVE